jgi:hypothetical protein
MRRGSGSSVVNKATTMAAQHHHLHPFTGQGEEEGHEIATGNSPEVEWPEEPELPSSFSPFL